MLIILIAIIVVATAAWMMLRLIRETEIDLANKHEIDLTGETDVLKRIRENKIT